MASILLLFYWTHLAFDKSIKAKKNEIQIYKEKIRKVSILISELHQNNGSSEKITGGLLSFFQNTTRKIGLEDKMVVIKPKISDSGYEAAKIRFENLNLNDFISIIKMLDSYSNLKIKHLEITKRFDNPRLINLDLDILRLKN